MAQLPGQFLEALSAPLGDLIAAVGRGVADAQQALDASTIAQLRAIHESRDDVSDLLRLINYQPTWYAIPETTGELSVALTLSGTVQDAAASRTTLSGLKLYAAPVDASYTSKFGFNIQATSKVTFRIVTVPPSAVAEQLRVVPDLVKKSFKEATELLTQLGISFTVAEGKTPADADLIIQTSPPAGNIVRGSDAVTLQV